VARLIVRASDALHRLCRWGALAGVLLMVVLIGIQVVTRYLLSEPPAWTEEGARYAMVWAGLLGATLAFRWRQDPVLIKLRALERGPGRAAGRALRAIATIVFLGPIWFYSLFGPAPGHDLARGFLARTAERSAEAMGVPMVWFAAAVPVAITVIFVHLAAQLAGHADARRES
jgi:TRAP-type C4-dicarboxylate transport system permease small subunit